MSILEAKHKRYLLQEVLSKLDNIQYNDQEVCSWFVRDINKENNHTFFRENYDYLRMHFPKLPRIKKSPAKLTSQSLHLMVRDCGYDCKKWIRCYMIDDNTTPAEGGEKKKKKRMKSTSAYVCVCERVEKNE